MCSREWVADEALRGQAQHEVHQQHQRHSAAQHEHGAHAAARETCRYVLRVARRARAEPSSIEYQSKLREPWPLLQQSLAP